MFLVAPRSPCTLYCTMFWQPPRTRYGSKVQGGSKLPRAEWPSIFISSLDHQIPYSISIPIRKCRTSQKYRASLTGTTHFDRPLHKGVPLSSTFMQNGVVPARSGRASELSCRIVWLEYLTHHYRLLLLYMPNWRPNFLKFNSFESMWTASSQLPLNSG